MNEIIKRFFDKGLLVSPNLINKEIKWEDFFNYACENFGECLVVNEELLLKFLNKNEIKRELPREEPKIKEPEKKEIAEEITKPVENKEQKIESKVNVIKCFNLKNTKKDINSFVRFYSERYSFLKNFLSKRDELKNTVSIKKTQEIEGNVSVIGLVNDIKVYQNSCSVFLEDPTGIIRAIIPINLKNKTEELVYDEVIGITGTKKNDVIFARDIFFPGILNNSNKSCPDDVNAVFISDTHIGSKMFLSESFKKFINWLNLKVGDEKQKELARNVRYLFITGDIVDGVGVYPEQKRELEIIDFFKQYEEAAKYLSQIPDYIKIIISPGTHDALRAEPQPPIPKEFAESLYKLPNVVLVSNPAYVNIHSLNGFEGVNVLMYHGDSFDYFVANVPMLRGHGYERADLIMNFLLKKRHLAPTHGATLINPTDEDFLLIDMVPDIFVTAHIHKACVSSYRKIVTISSSCFQDRTAFQEKVGHMPEPAKVPVYNLKTKKVSILSFGDKDKTN